MIQAPVTSTPNAKKHKGFSSSCRLLAAVALAVYITFPAAPTVERVEKLPPPAPAAPAAAEEKVRARFSRLPLQFEPNRGQAASGIRFAAHGAGFGLYLEDASMRLVVPKAPRIHAPGRPPAAESVDLKFGWGPGRVVEPVGEDPLPAQVHYLIGNDPARWRTHVRPFRRVRYSGVYPGIDLVVYGNRQQPEYDFIVAAGADLKRIRLHIEGARHIAVDPRGRLRLDTDAGTLIQSAPVVYQTIEGSPRFLAGRYVLSGSNRIGFEVTGDDPAYPLVIDPVLLSREYATYLGGSGAEVGFAVAVDASGNAYVAGRTASTNFPTQSPLQGALGGGSGSDAYIAKLNANGSALVYSTYLGGSGFEEALGLAVDASGQAHVTGRTTSTDLPTQSALQGALGGGSGEDAFVAKLAADGGTLVYSTYLGGSGTDQGHAIAVDASGNAYVTGQTDSTDFPTASARQGALGGGSGQDAFVTKINSSGGALVYSTYHGGSGADQGKGIATDLTGNAYVTGSTQSTDFPTQNAFQGTIGDGTGAASDAFVSKLNSTGSSLTYSTYLGGAGEDVGNAVAADTASKVVVTGHTASADFPTQGALQASLGGGSGTDAFVSRVLADGSGLDYSTYLGGSSFDEGLAVAVDLTQNAYVAGRTDSTDFPVNNALQSSLGGGSGTDGFAVRVNSFGSGTNWATYIGGSGTEQATGVAVDTNQNVFLTGFTGSGDFPTQNPLQGSIGGGGLDAFVAKLSSTETNPELLSNTTVISPYWQSGGNIYTFIAITHPSLEGMNSQIGVRVLAFLHSGPQYAPAVEFTVDAGTTQRLFIVRPDDPDLNATRIPQAAFILGTEGSGWVRFVPIASDPTQPLPGAGGGFPDITMLSYWGAVVVKGDNTGFAVAFIGDAADSAAHPGMAAGRMPSGLR